MWLLSFFFLGDGFNNGVRGVSVLLVQLASFRSKSVCLLIVLEPTAGPPVNTVPFRNLSGLFWKIRIISCKLYACR